MSQFASLVAPARWFGRTPRNPSAPFRLICFHHAGGSASAYARWFALLPRVDVLAVQLPGREARIAEPVIKDIHALVPPLVDALMPELDRQYAMFGHSMGTLVAYEVVRELRRRGARLPVRLYVSGRRAPHTSCSEPLLHTMIDCRLLSELERRYGGMPAAIVDDPQILALYLPIIRADMTLLETYSFQPAPRLSVPITVYGGLEDPGAQPEILDQWQALSAFRLSRQHFPGGHFYLSQRGSDFLPAFTDDLMRTLATANGYGDAA
jgi:surfactin synthase thioesterase subunit